MNPRVIFIILTAATASLLEIIDASIVNVAIPTMMGNIGATLDEISWVTTGYMIANSIVLPIGAWLGARLGRKNYFTGAILLFTVSSFACGIAPNLPTLIVFRILQGLAGGALLPTSQTLIQEQFPPEKAGMAMAIFGLSVMVGPALGPTLGGYLTDNFGWRSIFNVNVPMGLIAASLSWMYVENIRYTTKSKGTGARDGIDWWGLFFLCVGVGCFQYVLERGQADGWWASRAIRACAVFAVLGISSFIYWELKIPNPIMNLRLFKSGILRSGTMLGLPPMNQMDLAATPMRACFQAKPDPTPYQAVRNRIALDEMNKPIAQLRGEARKFAKLSSQLDFDDGDLADEDVLNRILWQSVKGDSTPYPENLVVEENSEKL